MPFPDSDRPRRRAAWNSSGLDQTLRGRDGRAARQIGWRAEFDRRPADLKEAPVNVGVSSRPANAQPFDVEELAADRNELSAGLYGHSLQATEIVSHLRKFFAHRELSRGHSRDPTLDCAVE